MRIKRSFKEFPVLFLKLCLSDILFKGLSCGALNQNFKLQYITCPDPGFVRNANRFSFDGRPSFKKDSFQVNEVVKYVCQRNFIMIGPSSIICLGSGSWSARIPRCKPPNQRMQLVAKTCQDPGFVSHANRFSGDGRPSLKNTFQVNEILIYRCRRNFVLKGPSYIRCLESGFWSAEVPRCSRYKQRLRIIPRVKTCKDPGMVPNAIRLEGYQGRSLKEFHVNQTVMYICQENYTLEGSSDIVCLESGLWSDPLPKCIHSNQNSKEGNWKCPDPGIIANGTRSIFFGRHETDTNLFEVDSVLKYVCKPTFAINGSSYIECLEDGSWSDPPPTCVLKSQTNDACCYDPIMKLKASRAYRPAPRRNDATCPIYYPEDVLEFYCTEPGKYVQGQAMITCLPTGKWSRYFPMCVPYNLFWAKITDVPYNDLCRLIPKKYTESGSTPEEFINKFEDDLGLTFGIPARRIQFPWVVAISNFTRYGNFEIVCSATLLNRNTVVTAAHCLENLKLNKTRLYFGKYYLWNDDDDAFVQVAIPTLFIIHVNYSADTYDSDIALIKFHPPVTYTRFVHHVCISLPTTPLSERDFNDTHFGVLAGWGMTEKFVFSQDLKFVRIPIIPSHICLEGLKKVRANVTLSSNMLCAGDKKGTVGPCQVDSGGGLFFPKDDGRSLVLVGIVSFGAFPECHRENKYDFFTNVANFVPWIQEYL